MENPQVSSRLRMIIHQVGDLEDVKDIYQFFEEDRKTPFKTVAKWNI